MYGGNGNDSGASHVRRRSSKVVITPTLEPATGRTPKLEQMGFGGDDRAGLSAGDYRYSSATYLQRTLGYFLRILRTPRGLASLASAAFVWLLVSYVNRNSQALSTRPVPQSILPIIRQGGNLVHRVSPHYGARIKSWHDYQVQSNPNRSLTPEEVEQRSQHTFHPNGLLLVNDRGRHPIQVLIERAEQRWKAKCDKQSRTLSDAVREYKQRYRRNPPKGFDDWWKFAEQHNVQLRDEYDQIAHDLAPHWALEAHDSRHRNKVMQDRDHTFTISMMPGEHPTANGPYAYLERATDLQDLLSMYAARMPRPLNLTFIMDDNPAVMLSYTERDRMVELASQGEYFGPSEFVEPDDPNLSNFAQACAPNSPLRRSERGEFTPDYSGEAQRSFIWDHGKVMDLCQHPEGRKLHGHTMQQGVPLGPLVPLLSFAKTRMHADILATPLEQYSETYIGYEPPWEQKSQNKLLWRGSTTGVEFDRHTPWRQSQRARLHMMSQNMAGDVSVIVQNGASIKERNISVESLNHLYMDTSFSGSPAQCDPETCEIMRNTLNFRPTIGLEESNQYKYLFDVDGNGWSGRFHRLMSTRSLVLKSTTFPEWYQDRVEPWVHYVPIKIDYSDVYDIMTYFVGTPDGRGGHDSVAEKIGEAGRVWAGKYWRKADMAAYMYRLSLEYSRILHHDEGEDLDYVEMPTFDY